MLLHPSNKAMKWNFIILLEIRTLSLREVKWFTKATRLIKVQPGPKLGLLTLRLVIILLDLDTSR